MDDIPIVVPGDFVFDEDKLMIPAKQVALVRSGTFAVLGSAAEDIGVLAGHADRETQDACASWRPAFARLDKMRSLLDTLGWASAGAPHDIEIDLRTHRHALLAALRTQMDAERGHAESLPETQRALAQAHVSALADLLERAETGS